MTASEAIQVWLIEDNSAYRESVVRALGCTNGIRCSRSFSSVEDALPALQEGPHPQVILLDLGLPGVDGISAIQMLLSACPGCRILVLTVFNEPGKIFSAICAGAAGHLLKTASLAEISEAIRQVMEGGAPMTPQVARLVLDRFARLAASGGGSGESYRLTSREQEVLEMMVRGLIKKEIASRLCISLHTVSTHIRKIYEKLQVTTNTAAVSKALREGLVSPKGTA